MTLLPDSQALTITAHGGRLRELKSECHFSPGFDPRSTPVHEQPAFQGPFMAVWDTGAMASVISRRVVTACGLAPIGMALVHGVHGSSTVERFMVNVRLPNHVSFANVAVTLGELAGCDALIGMDIITLGDFALTNRGGRTVFSFRTPSQGLIDYVKHIDGARAGRPPIKPGQGKKKKNKKR